MSVVSREKIALVVFAGLIVLSLIGFGWYLLAGHSWNVAASNIDDTFGSMDGYTAIVYPGTKLPEADAAPSVGAADKTTPSAKKTPENRGPQVDSDLPAPEEKLDPSSGDLSNPSSSSGEDSQPLVSPSDSRPRTSPLKEAMTVDKVKESYESKNATVFSLDASDLEQYREGTILKKGSHRFGVFSVTEPISSIMMEKQIAYFKRYKVDFIVALTPEKSYVENASGLDIVICTGDEGLFVMGETHNGTFYVDTPTQGRVGAILISPSNVVSAKVIEDV